MFKDLKVIVIMPAYNASQTLRRTYEEVIGQDYVDQVIVVDDKSQDNTMINVTDHLKCPPPECPPS